MNFFGVEVSLSRTAAEANKPVKKGLEIGDSGTRILDGIISEEYNTKLQDVRGVAVYEEMRKSDGTVRAAILATTLPIRSANWYVKPASDDPADVEIAEFVHNCLFDYQSITFDDLLRQALLSLPFGVMVFEKVFATRDVDGTPRIVWDKLAPRMPRSIQKWSITGGHLGITQNKSDGRVVEIPIEKLIIFVNEMEGDNWWGTSILRSAYKHWFIKNTIYKIDAIAFERQGLGVPYAKLPENYTERDRQRAEDILKNLRANSQAYIVEPHDYEIGFKDMQSDKTRDPQNSIAHHNREIMKSVLAQFIELGATGAQGASGSRALSEDHSELFLQSIETIAHSIAGAFNKYAVRQLVDLNFDNVKQYPELTHTGINERDAEALAETYQKLTAAGGLQPGSNDEQYFRELLGLPEREPDDVVERPSQPKDADPEDDPDEALNAREPRRQQRFAEGFKPYRKLTFAEQKVEFEALRQKMDDLEAQFDAETRALLHESRDRYMAAFTKAAHAGDTRAIKDATLKVQNEYARIVKQALQGAFVYGKNNAAREIGADAPPNPTDMLRQIDIQAAAIAEMQIVEITSESKNAYVQALNKGSSVTAALGAADAAAAAAIDRLTRDAGSILMSGYINHGRNLVFERNSPDVYALQRSELLDPVTCNYCLSVDGRVVEKDDAFAKNTIFHSNCRGIWVAILNDEENPPSIGGIPKSLRDRFGDAVNALLQPNKPITRKNTPARDEANRRSNP